MSFLLPPLEPHLQAALRDVRAMGVQPRVAAAERLGRADAIALDEAHQGLRTLLGDPVAQVRGAAVQSLALAARPEDYQALTTMLADSSPVVRELSIIALAAIDHPMRNATLLAALDHAEPEVRFQAILACGDLCPNLTADKLVVLSRDSDPRIRQAAARALTTPAKNGGPAQARLIALLSDDNAEVVWAAALALATHGHAQALSELLRALDDPARRLQSVEALAKYNDPQAITAVTTLAQAALKPPLLVAACGRTLLAMGNHEQGVLALRRALRAWRSEGRSHAVETVGMAQVEELVEDLVRLARRPRGVHPEKLLESLSVLAKTSKAALEGLRELAQRPDETGRAAAALLTGAAQR